MTILVGVYTGFISFSVLFFKYNLQKKLGLIIIINASQDQSLEICGINLELLCLICLVGAGQLRLNSTRQLGHSEFFFNHSLINTKRTQLLSFEGESPVNRAGKGKYNNIYKQKVCVMISLVT